MSEEDEPTEELTPQVPRDLDEVCRCGEPHRCSHMNTFKLGDFQAATLEALGNPCDLGTRALAYHYTIVVGKSVGNGPKHFPYFWTWN